MMMRGGAVMDIVVWLRSLGLGKYEAIFRENDIDETVLAWSLPGQGICVVGSLSYWRMGCASRAQGERASEARPTEIALSLMPPEPDAREPEGAWCR
jgi:hypothetical protein